MAAKLTFRFRAEGYFRDDVILYATRRDRSDISSSFVGGNVNWMISGSNGAIIITAIDSPVPPITR